MKDNNHIFDYIVLGQGLAGTVLIHELAKRNSNFLVIDGEEHTTSFAAAGIINPITGRNFIKSWLLEDLLPIALKTYHELENELGFKFLNQLDIVRTVNSIKEENDWHIRKLDVVYTDYLDSLFEDKKLNQLFDEKCKYSRTVNCYQVNIKDLILTYRNKLKAEEKYLKSQIGSNDITITDNIITIKEFQCKNVIFCQGFQACMIPLFKDIAFKFARGHSIIFKCKLDLDFNYKDDFYITPIGDNMYWTGYGNDWNIFDPTIDEQKILELKNAIESKINHGIEIVSTTAGIRPTMLRRRPVVSEHPLHKNVFIFNGLGTKGTSLAPFFAKLMIDQIFDKKEIPKDLKVSYQDASI